MASLPGATVLYRLKAEGGSRALGGPSEDRLAMCLWLSTPSFPGTRTVGDDGWEPQAHLPGIFQTLSLGRPGLEGLVSARTRGLRTGYGERAEFSD